MSILKDKWMEQAFNQMKLVFPDKKDSEILDFLDKEFEKDFTDTDCVIYNNYEAETYNTSLERVVDWVDNEKPILTESGTFFKRHSQVENLNTQIIINKLAERGVEKKARNKYKELANNEIDKTKKSEYKELAKKADLAQSRCKIILNSDYGVAGMGTSFLLN